jgi:hypothetical protein
MHSDVMRIGVCIAQVFQERCGTQARWVKTGGKQLQSRTKVIAATAHITFVDRKY